MSLALHGCHHNHDEIISSHTDLFCFSSLPDTNNISQLDYSLRFSKGTKSAFTASSTDIGIYHSTYLLICSTLLFEVVPSREKKVLEHVQQDPVWPLRGSCPCPH